MLLTRTSTPENMLSTAEASNLWDILKSHYMALELLQICGNYAHDPEFKDLIISYSKDLEENIHLLEGAAKKTGLSGPDKNRSSVHTPVNSETLYDEYLAQEFFILPRKTWNSCSGRSSPPLPMTVCASCLQNFC